MNGLTQEAFLALMVGVAFLAQFLFRYLRQKAEETRPPVPPEEGPHSTSTPEPFSTARVKRPANSRAVYKPVEDLSAVPSSVADNVSQIALARPRRFSRAGLMPDRRAVQDAVVIAAILQPCHAHRPHDAR